MGNFNYNGGANSRNAFRYSQNSTAASWYYLDSSSNTLSRCCEGVYTQIPMLRRAIVILMLIGALGLGADIPRKSPEFVIDMGPNKQILVSQYRGKVLCLVFILTT